MSQTEMVKRAVRRTSEEIGDKRLPGKTYNIRENEKAMLLNVSASWLQKDRCSDNPIVDFARLGRNIRYSRD